MHGAQLLPCLATHYNSQDALLTRRQPPCYAWAGAWAEKPPEMVKSPPAHPLSHDPPARSLGTLQNAFLGRGNICLWKLRQVRKDSVMSHSWRFRWQHTVDGMNRMNRMGWIQLPTNSYHTHSYIDRLSYGWGLYILGSICAMKFFH